LYHETPIPEGDVVALKGVPCDVWYGEDGAFGVVKYVDVALLDERRLTLFQVS
jgi:streptogramin lyase